MKNSLPNRNALGFSIQILILNRALFFAVAINDHNPQKIIICSEYLSLRDLTKGTHRRMGMIWYNFLCRSHKISLIRPLFRALKNWCFHIMVLEKTLEGPSDSKVITPINPKGQQPWIFIGRTDSEGEAPIFLPPDAKRWLFGKDPDAGKGWGQEERGK